MREKKHKKNNNAPAYILTSLFSLVLTLSYADDIPSYTISLHKTVFDVVQKWYDSGEGNENY